MVFVLRSLSIQNEHKNHKLDSFDLGRIGTEKAFYLTHITSNISFLNKTKGFYLGNVNFSYETSVRLRNVLPVFCFVIHLQVVC